MENILIPLVAALFSGFFVHLFQTCRETEKAQKRNDAVINMLFHEIGIMIKAYKTLNKEISENIEGDILRIQPFPSVSAYIYYRPQVSDALFDKQAEFTMNIYNFYMYTLVIENKLKNYSRHLTEKIENDKRIELYRDDGNYYTDAQKRKKELENLLIVLTNSLKSDFDKLLEIIKNIESLQEFKKVQRIYKFQGG